MNAPGPFDTIESAQEFLALLGEQIDRAAAEVRAELADAAEPHAVRRRDAWQLVLYKVSTLSSHIASSRRLLNDLRTLRNLLHRNSAEPRGRPPDGRTAGLGRP